MTPLAQLEALQSDSEAAGQVTFQNEREYREWLANRDKK